MASTRDCINMEKIENEDDAWWWIWEMLELFPMLLKIEIMDTILLFGTCNFGFHLPQMRSTKSFLLKMWKDLKQWCHENHHPFIEGNKEQDKTSIGYGKDIKNMIDNPLFDIGSIMQHALHPKAVWLCCGKKFMTKILITLIIFL